MVPKPDEEPTVLGPAEEGSFVLIGDDQVVAADGDPELAMGSDVHDVEDLERQLGAESLDDVLKAYLDEGD